jgi:hypothetical protein
MPIHSISLMLEIPVNAFLVILVSYSILVVLKDIYRDPTVKFFYFDRITRSKILKSANSLFKFIVINKKFEDYFGIKPLDINSNIRIFNIWLWYCQVSVFVESNHFTHI